MSEKKRVEYIDTLAGVFILYMIWIHVGDFNWVTRDDSGVPLGFFHLEIPFIAWFFFRSGMLSKARSLREEWAISVERFLWPLVIFSAIGLLVYWVRLYVEFADHNWQHYLVNPIGALLVRGSIQGNEPMWFVFSLCVVRLIHSVIGEGVTERIIAMVMSLGLALTIAFVIQRYDLHYFPYYLGNICLGLFFYEMGRMLKETQFQVWVFILATIVCLSCNILLPGNTLEFHKLGYKGNPMIWVVMSFGFIVMVNNLFRLIPLGWTRLHTIGRKSMLWFGLHWPLILFSRLILLNVIGMESGWERRILQFVFIVVVCKIAEKYYKNA